VKVFAAAHGQKGATHKAMGDMLRKMGIEGSDKLFINRVEQLLVWHTVRLSFSLFYLPSLIVAQDPDQANEAVTQAIDDAKNGDCFGAPLDALAEMKVEYAEKTEKQREALMKKTAEDEAGGAAIRNASLMKMRRRNLASPSDDDEQDDSDNSDGTDSSAPFASVSGLPVPSDVAVASAAPTVPSTTSSVIVASFQAATSDVFTDSPAASTLDDYYPPTAWDLSSPSQPPSPSPHGMASTSGSGSSSSLSDTPASVLSIPSSTPPAAEHPATPRKNKKRVLTVKTPVKVKRQTKRVRADDSGTRLAISDYVKQLNRHQDEDFDLRSQQHQELLDRIDQGNKQHAEALVEDKAFKAEFLNIFKSLVH
jgi:hypothetical protein